MATAFRFPRYWWGEPGAELLAPTHSVGDLLRGRLMDSGTAALLWTLIARRASFVVVGGHARGTGKTTTLTALLGFAPGDTAIVVTRGRYEDFSFAETADAHKTYVLAGEFSDHTPAYLWGGRVTALFGLAERGYAFAGTMHAESIEELLAAFLHPPVAVPPDLFARALPLTLFQTAFREQNGIHRRLTGVHWIQPAPRGPGGMGVKSLVAWSPARDSWTQFSSPDTWDELARWSGTTAAGLRQEIAARDAFLRQIAASAPRGFDAVRAELAAFDAQVRGPSPGDR